MKKTYLFKKWPLYFWPLMFALFIFSTNAYGQAVQISLEQTRTGPAGSPYDPAQWQNGNVNSQHAHFVEGYSIGYRSVITNLTPGTYIEMDLEFDTRHGSANALDFLTYYSNLDPVYAGMPSHEDLWGHHPPLIDPLVGYNNMGAPQYITILPPSTAAMQFFNEFHADNPNMDRITIWGGTPAAVSPFEYINEGPLVDATSSTSFRIKFTATQSTVIIAWGGHIAREQDWGPGNSAGGISGSPYHMRLLDWNIGNLGNMDRSMQAAAILTIPSCEFEVDPVVCDNTIVTATLIGDAQSGVTYSWALVDNTSGASPTSGSGTSFNFNSGNQAGSVTVRLTASVSFGGSTIDVVCEQVVDVSKIDLSLQGFDADCYESDTGSITATFSGGVSPYRIRLGAGPWVENVTSPHSFNDLAAGNYTVFIEDAAGCEASDQVTIDEPDELVATVEGEILCFGGFATLSIEVTGGVGPYTLTDVDEQAIFVNEFGVFVLEVGVDSGEWKVIDNNGCEVPVDIQLEEPDELIVSLTPTDLDCYGDGSGEISASWTGGTGPFDIYLDGQLVASDVASPYVFDGLDAGDYNVEVMDANGCADDDDVTVSQPDELIVSLTPTDLDCYGDGSGEISASWTGGTGPFDIYLDGQLVASDVASPYVFDGLDAGDYNVEVMDANGCADDDDVTVNQPDELIVSLTPTDLDCYGDGSGEISASWTGGTGPFDIYLDGQLVASDVASPYVFDGLDAGDYNVEVMDANGCADDDDVTVNQPDELIVSLTPTDLDCYGDGSGEISASWTGGTGPFDIYLDGQLVASDVASPYVFDGLDAGDYNVEVMDANGCADDDDVTVGEPDELIVSLTPTDLDCFGDGSGEVSASWTGGTGPFDIYLDGQLVASDVASPYVFDGLDAGDYNVEVMDANGCADDDDVTVSQPDELIVSLTPTDLDCYGDGSGEISASWTGGTGPFDIYLDGQLVASDVASPYVFDGLDAGDYNVEVMDANGCADDDDVTVSQPDELIVSLTPTDLDCFGDGSGEISASWTGGTGPFDIYLDGQLVASDVASPYVFDGLDAGDYNVEVMDANGCADDDDVTVGEPDELIVSLTPTDLDCYGDGSGEISASWTGGTGPFDIYLDGQLVASDVASPYVFDGLDAGDYNVEVMDANGCADDDDVTVSQPDELVCEIIDSTDSDCEASNGSATVQVSGGTEPYTYTWKDEFDVVVGNEATVSGLAGGVYKVYIVDDNGCETDCEVTIVEELCEEVCETAYAMSEDNATCFIPTFNNWGWTNLIEGPGTYEWPLWAGAGQCDTDNGELAGTVSVVYDVDGNVSVTFNIISPWHLEETHVYAGETMFPQVQQGRRTTFSVAPGQYFNAGPFDGGPIYVIAHAVVCKFVPVEQVAVLSEQSSADNFGLVSVESRDPEVVIYPNPFEGRTQISFSSDRSTRTLVEVFTIQGAKVATLFDGQVQAGDTRYVTFSDDGQLSRRIYLVVVSTDYGRVVRQIITF
jgi:hypothetical protein